VLPEFVTPEGYLTEGRLSSMTGDGTTIFTRSSLEAALWSYGEDQLLEIVRNGLSKTQVEGIGIVHCKLIYQVDPAKRSGAGYASDKAMALAAVEILEGQARQLARGRRRPPK